MYTIKIDHMNLNQIADSGQCFRWKQVNNNTYKIPAFGKEITISQNNDLFTVSCDETEWNNIWYNYFDLDTNYNEIESIVMKSNDEFLKAAYQFGSGIRILRQDLWETIISFIISQNNNIPRIKKSIEKLCDENNGVFPDYHKLMNMDLSDKGLGYRDKYLKSACLCGWWTDLYYTIQSMSYNEVKTEIMKIKGIGNKVADCICLFGLHYLDAFPIDTHINKIIDMKYNGNIPEWANSKYAGVLQQYIFYYDLKFNKI